MSESRILVRLLQMYFPWNWEFGSALSKLRNFGGWGLNTPNPPLVRHWCRACAGLTQRRIMKTLSLARFRRSVVPPCSRTAWPWRLRSTGLYGNVSNILPIATTYTYHKLWTLKAFVFDKHADRHTLYKILFKADNLLNNHIKYVNEIVSD